MIFMADCFYGYYHGTHVEHGAKKCGCIGGLLDFGDKDPIYFLTVEESVHTIATPLDVSKFNSLTSKPGWDDMLRQAAGEFGIDLTGLTPNWTVGILYL